MEPLLVHPDPRHPSWRASSTWAATRGRPWPTSEMRHRDPRRRLGRRHRGHRRASETAWACAGPSARATLPVEPLLLLLGGNRLDELELRDELYDDFCLDPVPPPRARGPAPPPVLAHRGRARPPSWWSTAAWCSTWRPTRPRSTAQPLDLTYMEYELLKFLAQHPGKVFTRETLLSRVWGYEYYGGARTVDVHIRRLPVRPEPLGRLSPTDARPRGSAPSSARSTPT
jgi:hypothetical protein